MMGSGDGESDYIAAMLRFKAMTTDPRARIAELESALSDLVLYLGDIDPSPHDSCDPASCVLAEARRVLEEKP